MTKRTLGGIDVAPLAFGGNVFGWTIDEKRSHELLDAFVEAGFNLIDTSDSYSRWVPGHQGGESETIIGNWIKRRGNRDKVVIATKVGSDMGLNRPDLSAKWILEEVENSLRRLNTDYIDLYQSHFDDLTTPVGETMEAFANLVKAGKVRVIGASNLDPERLLSSINYSKENALPVYDTLQPEYNLYSRKKFETEYLSLCEQEGLMVLPYFALASGFLSGKYRSHQDAQLSIRGSGVVKKYLNERGERILKALDQLASENNTSHSAIALAWLISKPYIAAPIASATTTQQLGQLMAAAHINLDEIALTLLDKASSY